MGIPRLEASSVDSEQAVFREHFTSDTARSSDFFLTALHEIWALNLYSI